MDEPRDRSTSKDESRDKGAPGVDQTPAEPVEVQPDEGGRDQPPDDARTENVPPPESAGKDREPSR